jgi:hypothetical protein
MILVFCKDRIWQLKECLRLLRKFAGKCKIVVLYFGVGDDVVCGGDESVEVVKECVFEEDLNKILADCKDDWVMFCVDDLICYDEVKVDSAAQMLRERCDVFSVQFRLNSDIKYSHVQNKSWIANPPLLDSGYAGFKVFLAPALLGLAQIAVDWSCPFDLSGAMYRKADILKIMKLASGKYSNPNSLEVAGNQVIYENGLFPNANCFYLACPSSRVLSLVTVNRVQDAYPNPVYRNLNQDQYDFADCNLPILESNFDPRVLNQLLQFDENDFQFDESRYQRIQEISSVHIPYFYLSRRK